MTKKIENKKSKEIVLKIQNISLKIVEEEDKIVIHSDKDIFLSSNGNIVSKADNYNIVFGRQIHLNPKISNKRENNIIDQVKQIEDDYNKGEN